MEKCLKVRRENAETARKRLLDLGCLNPLRKIAKDENHVYLPLKNGFDKEKITALGAISSKNLAKREGKRKNLAEMLSKKLTKKEMALLKTSFDVFGDIVLAEIPPELVKKEKTIGEAFLKLYKNVRAVFKKTGAVKGIERVRPLKRIAGTGTSEATCRENGCTFKFDIGTVFFTPRLSTERAIIAAQVKPGEVVLDMFSGCGPFAIQVAKKQPLVKKIYAVDINKSAVDYLKQNIALNKVSGLVEAHCGDSTALVPRLFSGKVDRVIMNLPKTSMNFLPSALKALKPAGGTIHYYTFKKSESGVILELGERLAGKKYEILAIRNVKPYAPREYCFAADIKIYK